MELLLIPEDAKGKACFLNDSEVITSRFNSRVFNGRLPADMEIAWSAHLKTTAGTTHFRREPPAVPFTSPRQDTETVLFTVGS